MVGSRVWPSAAALTLLAVVLVFGGIVDPVFVHIAFYIETLAVLLVGIGIVRAVITRLEAVRYDVTYHRMPTVLAPG